MKPDLLIDVSRLIGRIGEGRLPTGIDRVCLAYVRQFAARTQAVVQKGAWRRILPMAQSQELFSLLLAPPPNLAARTGLVIAGACVPPWPEQDGAGRLSLNLGHTGLEKQRYADWLRKTRQRCVYFVHDLIPLTHPEYCRPGEHAAHAQRMRVVLETGAGVIANSADTLRALEAFAKGEGLRMPASVVAHLAAAPLPPPDASVVLPPAPYFVVLGTLEPRKNHLLLLNVWREMAVLPGADTPHLVVIGQRGWESENAVDMLERCAALRGLVHEFPACTDAQMAAYVAGARALLFPSFAEGYGMPMAEAFQLGTPVIASDLAVFREVAGGTPDYLHPLDGPAWVSAVREYARPASASRARQLARMRSLRLPGWDAHFSIVRNFMEQLE